MPDIAKAWIMVIKKIFRVIRCSEDEKLDYTTFLLEEEVEYWWDGMQQLMESDSEAIT